MPKRVAKTKEGKAEHCRGGDSYGCDRTEHPTGRRKFECWRCHKYMGCSNCISGENELVCNLCHNWANLQTHARHGAKVPLMKQIDAMKIVGMRERGQINDAEVDRMFAELWAV